MIADEQISSASQEAIESAEKLYNAIQDAFPEAVTDFEFKWTAAQAVSPTQITSARYHALLPKYVPALIAQQSRCLCPSRQVRGPAGTWS